MATSRLAYEREVRALAEDARRRLANGEMPEQVARLLVARRNALKIEYRAPLDPALRMLLEQRNRRRYGDPIGPTADQLLIMYGSWKAVIAAAARPARIVEGRLS